MHDCTRNGKRFLNQFVGDGGSPPQSVERRSWLKPRSTLQNFVISQ
jgi:hypothetical protein